MDIDAIQTRIQDSMKTTYILFTSLLLVCSCEKINNPSANKVLLDEIVGEYCLIDINWSGNPIDINNDGEKATHILPEFLKWDPDLTNDGFRFNVSTKNDRINYASGLACFPIIQGRNPYSFYCGMGWLSFTVTVDDNGIRFVDEKNEIILPDNSFATICPMELSEPQFIFRYNQPDEWGHRLRHIIISFKASLYDYGSDRIVSGDLSLDYVTGYSRISVSSSGEITID